MSDQAQRYPRSSEISAALAALGVYARNPSAQDLEEQAHAAGGESVLAAMLANALYGAAIGMGMISEGRMQEQRGPNSADLSLARSQALKASGAEGPGFVGAMHWQAAHIAGPLRALKDHQAAPLAQALAAVSWALVLLLQAMSLAEPAGSRAREVADALTEAREQLATAEEHLDHLDEQIVGLGDTLALVIAAVEDSVNADPDGHDGDRHD
ncbi:MAG: DUF6245 family protein [Solirubrobacteraceae bacterium]